MLDMAQSVFIPYIFEENQKLYENFKGFVFYPNTVTLNGWTAAGAPPVFGGYEYSPENMNSRFDVSLTEKTNESLLLMPLIFSNSGYSVTITDPPYADNNWKPDLRIFDNFEISSLITDGVYTNMWLKRNNITLPLHSSVLKRNILWYSIMRSVPYAFRQGIYYNGSWCAPFSEHRMRNFLNGYAVLDFLDELTDFYPDNENTLLIMTNNTPHESYYLQAPYYTPQLVVNDFGSSQFNKEIWFHSNAAAINRLAEYFIYLKQNDIYDNTRIIIVSDHGRLDTSYVTKLGLPFHVDQFNPVLLVKDFNSSDDFRTDMTFMTNADVPVLAMQDIIEDTVNPFTGKTISSDPKNDPLLILIHRAHPRNNNEFEINNRNSYYIKENIFKAENWIPASGLQ